jgi:hypothetical protein
MDRVDAQPQPDDSQRRAHALHQLEVPVELVAGLVDGTQGLARELELPTRLERDAAAPLGQGDQVPALADALPAIRLGDRLEERSDPPLPLVRHRGTIVFVEPDLLVLGAHAPVLRRLLPAAHVLDQLVDRLDGSLEIERRRGLFAHARPPVPA